jgi:hypothetical protein
MPRVPTYNPGVSHASLEGRDGPLSRSPAVYAVVFALVLVVPVVALAQGDDSEPCHVAVGGSYSSIGDFGDCYGVRAQLLRGPWMVQGGWDRIDATLRTSQGLGLTSKGNMWSLDASYLLWSMNPEPMEKPGRPDFYYGLGLGVHNIDADWALVVDPDHGTSAKKIEPSGHVVAGARWKNAFLDVRYVWTSSFFGYGADGVQGTLGLQWAFGGGE